MRFFKIVAKAAVSFYEELFFFFLTGLIYVMGFILIIPGPFALAGIYRISQRAVRGKAVKWRIVWQGVKEFGLRTFLIFVLIVLGFVLLVTNLWFYNSPEISPFPADVGVWVTPLWILLILLWSGVAFYATAFLFELEEPRIFVVLRNSLFLTVLRPIQTLLFLIISVLALVISVALPVLLTVSPAFIATLSVTAVRALVTDLKEQAEQRQAVEQEEEAEDDGEE